MYTVETSREGDDVALHDYYEQTQNTVNFKKSLI